MWYGAIKAVTKYTSDLSPTVFTPSLFPHVHMYFLFCPRCTNDYVLHAAKIQQLKEDKNHNL